MSALDVPRQLTAIYDAAYAADRWTQALDAFGSVTQATGVLIYDVSEARALQWSLAAANSRYKASALREKYDRFVSAGNSSGFDAEGVSRLGFSKPFDPVLDTDIWSLEDFSSRPEVCFVRERAGTFRRFFFNLSTDPIAKSGVLLHYDAAFDTIPGRDIAAATMLAPHLGKAIEMHRMAFALRRRYRAVLSVLDRIALGICILDERAHVLVSNSSADSLLGDRDGIWLGKDGRPVCRKPDDTTQLRAAAARIAATADARNDETGLELTIARASTADPVLAIVSPLRDADMELEAGLSGALLTLVDPLRAAEVRLDAFGAAYRLTATQTAVAGHLFRGASAAEVADLMDVAPETARSHIKAILGKTMCRNRVAFVWRVFQFAPPIL